MIIHFRKFKNYKKHTAVIGGTLVLGMALLGFFEVRRQIIMEAPAVKLEEEDISIKFPPASELDDTGSPVLDSQAQGQDISLVLQPAMAAGMLEDMIKSDKILAEYRMERQRLRGQETSVLQEMMSQEDADVEMKTQASRRLIAVMERDEKEMRLEYLLKSSGKIEDCVVMMEGETIHIILPVQLSEEKVGQVRRDAARISGNSEEHIYIIMREEQGQDVLQEKRKS